MWTKNAVQIFLYVVVLYLSMYSTMCVPVLRRSEMQNFREILKDLYSNQNSLRNKRWNLKEPNLGMGTNVHTGHEMSDIIILTDQLAGSNSPGKRSTKMYAEI